MISRDALYELVWSKPMTKVGEQFGVSGNYMARVCEALNVPKPDRGYWAKRAVGKAPAPTPLPEARLGDPPGWSRDDALPPVPRKPAKAAPETEHKGRTPRSRAHYVIHGAKHHFEAGRPVDDGAYLKPYKKLLVDITTSKACLDGSIAFANDLFNAFEAAGHHVIIAGSSAQFGRATIDEREARTKQRDRYYHRGLWSPNRPTVVHIGGVAFGLAIVEMSEPVELRYVGGKYIREADYIRSARTRRYDGYTFTTTQERPSGRLRLTAYSPYRRVSWSAEWQETSARSLSSSIRAIVKSIEESAQDLASKVKEADRQAEIAHQAWLEAEERRRKEEEQRRIDQSVRDSREQLARVIQQWSNVVSVESFLAGVEQRAAGLPDEDRVPVLERLMLARALIGDRDPMRFFLSWKVPAELYQVKDDDDEP